MSLTPFQISLNIKSLKFSEAEQGILQFVLFNANDKNELKFASENNSFQSVQPQASRSLENVCNEYATVISELFCHPRYKPSEEIIATFLSYKFVIDWLFSASIWKNTDAIIDHLKLVKTNNFGQLQVDFNQKKIILLLALVCLSSKFRLPWKLLFKANPSIALSSYIGLVTQSIPALSAATSKGFNYLLESAKNLPILDLPKITDLGKLNYGYFNCSYATSPEKYEFKKWLTTLIRHNTQQWLDEEVKSYIKHLPKTPIQSAKPKIAVMLELYKQNHAMHRCFDGIFRNLTEHFELYAFIDEKEADAADLSVFDRVVTLKGIFDINENAKCIIDEQPDVIFYPSIGMKFWGIYLSQLRLAPLQIMTPGHPSSSYSPEIDYCLLLGCSTNVADLQPYLSEKILMDDTPFNEIRFHIRHEELTVSFISKHNHFLNDSDEIRVGINGVMTKVTDEIVDVCKEIQKRVAKKVTFVFFSGHKSNQLAYISAKKQIAAQLKHFDLVAYSDYLSYMKTISQCHFLLPTLPFGGSNSNIDAMILNKPKLFMQGKEQIYTRTDEWEWERVGLSSELGCSDKEHLVNKSLQLINDNKHRKKIYELIVKHCNLDEIFSKQDKNSDLLSHVFVRAIEQVRKW